LFALYDNNYLFFQRSEVLVFLFVFFICLDTVDMVNKASRENYCCTYF